MKDSDYLLKDNILTINKKPIYNDQDFKSSCEKLLESENERLIIDLSKIIYLSSREIGVLIWLNKRAREKNKTLLIKVSRALWGMLKILNLNTYLNLEIT